MVTLLVTGLVLGSVTGLLAASFALIISVTQRFHIAYVTTFALAAYGAIWLNSTYGWSVGLSAAFGLAVAVVVGLGIEACVYRPVSTHTLSRGANPLIPTFIVSFALVTVATSLIAIHFNSIPLTFYLIPQTRIIVGSAVFSNFDIVEVIVSWVLLLALHAYLGHTRRGQWIRAVRSNPNLAATVGINVGRIFLLVFAIGSLMSGVLGIMYAESTFAAPSMGFDQVFEGFLIAFLAGMDSTPVRIGIVGLIIGLITDLSQYWINPAFSNVVVFGILMIYVVYRSVVVRHPELALNRDRLRRLRSGLEGVDSP